MRNNKGQFVDGKPQAYPVGSVRIRTRHKRDGVQRAYIKIAEPNTWILRARYVWENANGAIPSTMAIHHIDGDKLNDALENLELVSRAEHLEKHRAEFQDKCIAALARARKTKTWTTRSATKRTGRHPANCDCPLHAKG